MCYIGGGVVCGGFYCVCVYVCGLFEIRNGYFVGELNLRRRVEFVLG